MLLYHGSNVQVRLMEEQHGSRYFYCIDEGCNKFVWIMPSAFRKK